MISLEPCSVAVAQAVMAFAALPLLHAEDWPHEDTYDAFRGLAEHPLVTVEGTFLILEDGIVVGDCGWFGPPDDDGEVEIGYGLAPSARGRGIGSSAVLLLVDWCRSRGARAVRAEVLPGNEPSIHLLLRLGFDDLGERAGHRIFLL